MQQVKTRKIEGDRSWRVAGREYCLCLSNKQKAAEQLMDAIARGDADGTRDLLQEIGREECPMIYKVGTARFKAKFIFEFAVRHCKQEIIEIVANYTELSTEVKFYLGTKCALENGTQDLVDFLARKYLSNAYYCIDKILTRAFNLKRLDIVRYFFSNYDFQKSYPSGTENNGKTGNPLDLVWKSGDLETLLCIIENGPRPHKHFSAYGDPNNYNYSLHIQQRYWTEKGSIRTPLLTCIRYGHVDLVRFLFKNDYRRQKEDTAQAISFSFDGFMANQAAKYTIAGLLIRNQMDCTASGITEFKRTAQDLLNARKCPDSPFYEWSFARDVFKVIYRDLCDFFIAAKPNPFQCTNQ